MKRFTVVLVLGALLVATPTATVSAEQHDKVEASPGGQISALSEIQSSEIENGLEMMEYRQRISNSSNSTQVRERYRKRVKSRLESLRRKVDALGSGDRADQVPRKEVLNSRIRSLGNVASEVGSSPEVIEEIRKLEKETNVQLRDNTPTFDVHNLQRSYNSWLENSSSATDFLLGSERVNVKVETPEGFERYYLISKNGRVVDSGNGSLDNPTLTADSDVWTLTRIRDAENSKKEFFKALNAGDLKYRPVSIGSKLKFGSIESVEYAARSVGNFIDAVTFWN
ncbi:MAG: hypothetical protein ABEK59_04080 [Halobacteria archaeon]